MDNQLSLYDAAGTPGCDEYLSSHGRWHPCLFFSPNYSQEEFLQGFLSSSCGIEEADFSRSHWNEDEVEETYAGEEHLPYYGCGNWLSEYGHSFCDSWEDGNLSLGNGIQKNEEGSELKEVEEDSGQCEEQYECHSGQGVTQEDYPTFDSSNWSCDSWFAYGGKTDVHGCNEQEFRTSHSYYPPEIGVFESIFGYWPCLYELYRH